MCEKKDVYDIMVNKYDKEVLSVIFYLKNKISKQQLCSFFELMNKNYPLYKYENSNMDNIFKHENNFTGKIIDELLKYELPYYDMLFSIPIFIQKENKVESVLINNGIGITIEKDDRFGFVFILDVFPNVFIDNNSYFFFDKKESKWLEIEIDQKLSAVKNRKVISNFLKELQIVFNRRISNIESLKNNEKLILDL